MTELLDQRRPNWVQTSTDEVVAENDERSLALSLYDSPWNVLVFEATVGSAHYATSLAIDDVERLLTDAGNGLASSISIGEEVVEHGPDAAELQLPIGPFLVTGPIDDWRAVLERERKDIAIPDGGGPPEGEAWEGGREPFAVLDSD
jgi:hypothetical protein